MRSRSSTSPSAAAAPNSRRLYRRNWIMSSRALASSLSLARAIVPPGAKFGEKLERVLIAHTGCKPFGDLLPHPGDLFRRLRPRRLVYVAADQIEDVVRFIGIDPFGQPRGNPLPDLGREAHLTHGCTICPSPDSSKTVTVAPRA